MKLDYVYDFHENHQLEQKKEKYVKRGLSGLMNLGNKCFLNSIVQCLSNTLKLTDYFLSNKHIEDDPEGCHKKRQEYFFVTSYANLILNVWETNQLLKPKSFVENISKHIKKYYTLQQQDSHECLLYILDLLHKGICYEIEVEIKGEIKNNTDALMKKSLEAWKQFYEKEYSFIIECFNGIVYNQIQCQNCTFSESIFEPYNCISLDIPNADTPIQLETCLQSYFSNKELIQSWHCEKCDKNGCTKLQHLWSIPNYFIIQLKRFTNNGRKNHTHVNFPLEDMDLTQFVSKSKNDPNNYVYSLYAINYHSGDTNSGHYWSCCKNLDNNWYLFNDGHVSKFHDVNDMFTKDAYILFYYRKFIKNPIQI